MNRGTSGVLARGILLAALFLLLLAAVASVGLFRRGAGVGQWEEPLEKTPEQAGAGAVLSAEGFESAGRFHTVVRNGVPYIRFLPGEELG